MRGPWLVAVVMVVVGCRDQPRAAERAAPAVARDAATPDPAAELRREVDRLDRAGQLAPALQASERLVAVARTQPAAALGSALEVRGRLLFQAGRWPEAEATLEEALALPVAKTDKTLRSALLFSLGSVYAAQRRNDEAIDVVEQSLALAEELDGKDSLAAANTAEVLAAAYDYAGRYAEAEQLFRRAIATYERAHAAPIDRGRALSNLALNLEYQRRDADALPIYERALPLLAETAGYDRTGLAEAQAGVARIHHRTPGKLRDAEAGYRAALATRRAALGDDHPSVAMDHHNLAVVLEDLRRVPEAIEACMRAEDIRAKVLEPDHPHRMETEGLCERLRKAERARRR